MSARRLAVLGLVGLLGGCEPATLDLPSAPFTTPDAGPSFPFDAAEARVELGRMLFFDPVLSGVGDIACSTCHITFTQTTEPIPLAIGTGGLSIAPTRTRGTAAQVMARNTSDLFHRGNVETVNLFWDGRVERLENGTIRAPIALPPGIDTVLEAQALLPLVTAEEMRGAPGIGPFGADTPNEQIFEVLVRRLLESSDYATLFQRAFPGTPLASIDIRHVAKALAAFQIELWDTFDSPFDVDPEPPEGSLLAEGRDLFFGRAGCARCHGGNLFTDQKFHNILVPQFGPGKDPVTHLDEGRFLVTHDPDDRFAFRTPSLRNVALTGPWMHNGAYKTLESAVRHHFDPEGSLREYDVIGNLPESLARSIQISDALTREMLVTFDPAVLPDGPLDRHDMNALLTFLESLTSADQLLTSPFTAAPTSLPDGRQLVLWPLGTPHPFRQDP